MFARFHATLVSVIYLIARNLSAESINMDKIYANLINVYLQIKSFLKHKQTESKAKKTIEKIQVHTYFLR